MSLRLRQLEIRISTLRGFFGIRLPLQAKGLVVVRANNTSGKSTCVQSLIYALGLEAMLTVSQQAPPLQYAVLERFQYGDEEVRVDESEVLLEMENEAGEIITIQRAIVGKMRKTNLVTVWRGPHLSQPSAKYSKADYFVRIEGAAQRPLGFHTFLASYLGWALPTVTRFDGSEAPLYVECIFPLFVIEQKHGWSGIQSRMPTHFRIREMGKRAIEFVLKLDSYEIAERRQRLRDQIAALEQRWEHIVGELDAKVGALGAVVRNLPKAPVSEWPIVPAPECLVFDGKEWDRVQSATLHANARLMELQKTEVPIVSSASARVASDLRNAQKQLAALEVLAARALRDNEVEEAQNDSIRERISALEADLQNYQDVKRLRDIGSDLKLSVATGRCPTCEQEINDVLLPQAAAAPPMSYDDNIKFISGQIVAFKTMLNDSERVLEARRRAVNGSRLKIEELRANIRAYKQTLTSPNSSASAADVRERMAVENALRIFETLTEQLDSALEQLEMLSREFAEYTAALEKLKGDTSEEDEGKLQSLQSSFVSQLDQYGFSSIKPAGLLHISRETYRPTYEGFDLGFNLSASDMIRTIWAYLYGLMEVARIWPTNHLGLLVLDEPRQQQADKVSFAEFARRAAAAGGAGQQVLFMTSEDPETLASMLSGVEHQYINFDGKMIQPMAVGITPLE
ncbi:MAG: hypothetical protein ACE14L_01070 [Terriglobales bacterium]